MGTDFIGDDFICDDYHVLVEFEQCEEKTEVITQTHKQCQPSVDELDGCGILSLIVVGVVCLLAYLLI